MLGTISCNLGNTAGQASPPVLQMGRLKLRVLLFLPQVTSQWPALNPTLSESAASQGLSLLL